MAGTNAGLIIIIAFIYTSILIGIGFIGLTFGENIFVDEHTTIPTEEELAELNAWERFLANIGITFTEAIGNTIESNIPFISPILLFFTSIYTGISVLPLWLNTIIFTPLIIGTTYLIIDLVWIG